MENNLKSYIKWKGGGGRALCSFIIIFISVLPQLETFHLYYDSSHYWNLGQSFVSNGTFSFQNFPNSFRGYFLPMLFSLFSRIGNIFGNTSGLGFYLCNSVTLAILITYVLPSFYKTNTLSLKRRMVGTLLISFILVFFWRQIIDFPLSDSYALIFLLLALILIKMCMKQLIHDMHWSCKSVLLQILAGFLLYGAYNTRTIYLLSVILFCLLFSLYSYFITRKLRIPAVLIICILSGAFFSSLPQMYINFNSIGQISPLVNTKAYNGDSLFLSQFYWGMQYSRYETYVGDQTIYPSPSVFFFDYAGSTILNAENISSLQDFSYGGLIACIVRHPLDIASVYVRHLVNYLSPVYPEGYITNLQNNKSILFLFNYLLYFTATASLLWKRKASPPNTNTTNKEIKKKSGIQRHCISTYLRNLDGSICHERCEKLQRAICWIVILAQCVAILPGAPEVRFFFPLYMGVYGYIAYCLNIKEFIDLYKRHWLLNSFCFLAVLAGWLAILTSTLSLAQYDKFLL